jgi:hypothetical protein
VNVTDAVAQAAALHAYALAEDRLRTDARYADGHQAPASARRLRDKADRVHRAILAEMHDPEPRRWPS